MANFNTPRCCCLAGAFATLALLSLAGLATEPGGLAGFAWAASPGQLSLGPNEQATGSDPWMASQTEQPAELVKQLSNSKEKPTAVCVGSPALYEAGHIPGASFHGPTSTPQGLDGLKKWAQTLARTHPIVIYCGCCPMTKCPNVRPAFKALQEMGFKQVKVLVIEDTFATDWAQKGYPVQKGK